MMKSNQQSKEKNSIKTLNNSISDNSKNTFSWMNRFSTVLKHISPSGNTRYSDNPLQSLVGDSIIKTEKKLFGPESQKEKGKENEKNKNKKEKYGFPRTEVKAPIFSRVEEKVYDEIQVVKPDSDLVEMPKGEPPPLEQVFRHVYMAPSGKGKSGIASFGGGHVCIVGPTGSGKSTIVRGLLCQLCARHNLAVYSLEYPVEVNLNTHGLFHVCQIDMFQEIQGRQRSLAETANSLLKHDPDIIYFGELRHKVDFETATSIALSGVGVISTGHAGSPIDLLQRLRSMNIDLKTQFRALKCIVGVKRVPILCEKCKKPVLLSSAGPSSGIASENYSKYVQQKRVLQLLNMYRIVTFSKHTRRQALPIVYVPPTPEQQKIEGRCKYCVNGYTHNHTIYEFLYITPDSDMETLRQEHTYTTEETLISLILEGKVNPLYLEGFL